MYYVGILDGAGEVWGVRIPDCPGCPVGSNTRAAISDAISALREWAAQMRADGAAVPPARTAAQVLADPENHPDVAAVESAVLFPLMLDAGRAVQTSRLMQDCSKPSTRRPDAADSRALPFWPV